MQRTVVSGFTGGASNTGHTIWGGFLLTRRGESLLRAKLTGRLSERTLDELDQRVSSIRRGNQTQFLVLDASHLQHIPISVAQSIAAREIGWRHRGVVALWVGLNDYLVNLLVLACGIEQRVPALADWKTARKLVAEIAEDSAPVARGHLVTCSTFVH